MFEFGVNKLENKYFHGQTYNGIKIFFVDNCLIIVTIICTLARYENEIIKI